MRDLLDALLSILLAPVCAACQAPLPHPTRGAVCEPCWLAIIPVPGPHCPRCGDPLLPAARTPTLRCRCDGRPSPVSRSRAAGVHDGALRAIVHALKYDGRRSLAPRLAALMAAAAPSLLDDATAVVPVPLHRARRRQRGFNQAEDLARHLGPPVCRALRRVRHTSAQASLHASERAANVDGAFVATHDVAHLQGATVVLVDDVRTTGATVEACAGTLKAAGVREVRVLTAARVAPPSP